MSEVLNNELQLFGICIRLGVQVAFVYDLFRIFRKMIPHKDILVDVEDLIFWIYTTILVFRTLFYYNQGELRAYAFLGMLLGVVAYLLSLSRLLMWAFRYTEPYWKKICAFMYKPLQKIRNGFIRELKKIVFEVTIAFKGR